MKVYDPRSGDFFFQKRRKRFDEPGHARELTFSCYQRLPLLNADRPRTWFLESLEFARRRWAFDLWAYVLMPEHVHLLICPAAPAKVGMLVGRLKEEVARKAIGFLRTNASHWLSRLAVREGNRLRHRFWQPGGGYDRNVTDPTTAHRMIEYIHANPVRRGLVARPEDWEWSSARWYAGIRPVPIEIDPTIPPCDEQTL